MSGQRTQSASQRRVKRHKLDPIERLPDGTLFRLTPGQLRSVQVLTKRCCNFLDGDWFRRAVLPQQPKLEQAILSPKKLRRCAVCGRGYLARSGRAKILPDLRQGGSPPAEGKIRPQTAVGRRQFGGEKLLNCKPSRTAKATRQYDFPRSREIEFYLST